MNTSYYWESYGFAHQSSNASAPIDFAKSVRHPDTLPETNEGRGRISEISYPDETAGPPPICTLAETDYDTTTYLGGVEPSQAAISRDTTRTEASENVSRLESTSLGEQIETVRPPPIGPFTYTEHHTNANLGDIESSQADLSGETTSVEAPENISRPESLNLIEQTKPSFHSRLPLKESLGIAGCATILGGSIAILAILAFLTLLWFGYGDKPEAADASRLWRQIALRDWMTRTITITSLALRFFVSLQVALCTSMIAALVLEKRSARKSDVAYLSIARSISDGPRKMVQLLLSSRSRSVLTYVELWLICLLALVMLVLQFSSTLLLSDLHSFVIVGEVETKMIANFYSPYSDNGEYRILWSVDSITPTYAVFGEESSNYNTTPDINGFSDTGTLRRGYLPLLGSDNRTSVRKYHGSTLVVNSRIVCVPPEMDGHIYTDELVESFGVGHMVGIVNYGQSLRHSHKGLGPLCAGHGCESVPFDCSIPGSLLNDSAQSNYCFIETVGRTSSAISLVYPSEYTGINIEAEPWSLNSSMFLVIRSNVTRLDWPEVVNLSTIPPPIATGEWNRFRLLGGGSFDVSLCFQRFYVQPQYTNMIAHQPAHEPILIWDGFNLEHDTTALATFVSANSPLKPPGERGLLDMDILPKPDGSMIDVKSASDGQTPAGASAAILQAFAQGAATNQFIPASIAGCEICNDLSVATIPEIALLFTDIIEATGRAAAALHSLTALVSASVYDRLLKVFNATEEIHMAVTTSVRTPGPCSQYQCSGFISVATLLGVHMVIVATITTLYVSQVRYSRCSNTWHAISQLMSEELEDVLNQGNNAEDRTITRALKRDGKDDFVKLGLTGDSTRVQVVKHADDNRRSSEDEGSLRLGVKIKQCTKRWFRRNEIPAT